MCVDPGHWQTHSPDTMLRANLLCTHTHTHTKRGMPQRSNLSTPHNPLLPSSIYSPLTLHRCCLRVSSHLPPPPPNTPSLLFIHPLLALSIYPPFPCLSSYTCPSCLPPPWLPSVSLFLSPSNNIPQTNCNSVSR